MAPRDSRSVNRCGHGHLACKFPINVTVPCQGHSLIDPGSALRPCGRQMLRSTHSACGGGRLDDAGPTDVIVVVCLMACKDFRRAVLLDEQHVVFIELGTLLHTRAAHWHPGDC